MAVINQAVSDYNFNPRPREEGDASSVGYKPQSDDFNPRPREEGDASSVGYKPQSDDFNPRPREEGDTHFKRR